MFRSLRMISVTSSTLWVEVQNVLAVGIVFILRRQVPHDSQPESQRLERGGDEPPQQTELEKVTEIAGVSVLHPSVRSPLRARQRTTTSRCIIPAATRAQFLGEECVGTSTMAHVSHGDTCPPIAVPPEVGEPRCTHARERELALEVGPLADVADPLVLVAADSARHVGNRQRLPGVGAIQQSARKESQRYDVLVNMAFERACFLCLDADPSRGSARHPSHAVAELLALLALWERGRNDAFQVRDTGINLVRPSIVLHRAISFSLCQLAEAPSASAARSTYLLRSSPRRSSSASRCAEAARIPRSMVVGGGRSMKVHRPDCKELESSNGADGPSPSSSALRPLDRRSLGPALPGFEQLGWSTTLRPGSSPLTGRHHVVRAR